MFVCLGQCLWYCGAIDVVVQDVSDDALELAAGGAQGGQFDFTIRPLTSVVAIADR